MFTGQYDVMFSCSCWGFGQGGICSKAFEMQRVQGCWSYWHDIQCKMQHSLIGSTNNQSEHINIACVLSTNTHQHNAVNLRTSKCRPASGPHCLSFVALHIELGYAMQIWCVRLCCWQNQSTYMAQDPGSHEGLPDPQAHTNILPPTSHTSTMDTLTNPMHDVKSTPSMQHQSKRNQTAHALNVVSWAAQIGQDAGQTGPRHVHTALGNTTGRHMDNMYIYIYIYTHAYIYI